MTSVCTAERRNQVPNCFGGVATWYHCIHLVAMHDVIYIGFKANATLIGVYFGWPTLPSITVETGRKLKLSTTVVKARQMVQHWGGSRVHGSVEVELHRALHGPHGGWRNCERGTLMWLYHTGWVPIFNSVFWQFLYQLRDCTLGLR